MATALWIVQVLIGSIFIITGSFKLFQSKAKVVASGGTWAEDFHPLVIKIIASVELLSGSLILFSKIFGYGQYLSPIAVCCIAMIMAGSIVVHIRRKEYLHTLINSIFLIMAIFVCFMLWAG